MDINCFYLIRRENETSHSHWVVAIACCERDVTRELIFPLPESCLQKLFSFCARVCVRAVTFHTWVAYQPNAIQYTMSWQSRITTSFWEILRKTYICYTFSSKKFLSARDLSMQLHRSVCFSENKCQNVWATIAWDELSARMGCKIRHKNGKMVLNSKSTHVWPLRKLLELSTEIPLWVCVLRYSCRSLYNSIQDGASTSTSAHNAYTYIACGDCRWSR